ncbi:related to cis-1,2-dihydro-1,2-dihydroxynaphthalene dehydrogenase [Rhynchosporium agropyri]|uniref:Related to cis-1,2-dihydro-1,2-dihydroxynaphthalene dehydrogenase n=1 Tax=Rhynchosporium agropyri TaxID=914238 RepID=A0A1E1JWG1_9HELO|nr:related to cis-1,2-dihydro-1,2-dihydroxynaphthalene dehydrogenase [Rhynchosporium agropyri]
MSTSPVILVTAGTAGLGAQTAKTFAAAGYRVVINYSNNATRASALLLELEKISSIPPTPIKEPNPGPVVLAVRADLADKLDVAGLVSQTIEEMGRLDVVFSNVGWTEVTDFNDLDDNVDEEMWDRCFNKNVKSHLWLFHAAKKYLEQSEGSFITTASVAGLKPSGSSIAYSVTKAAQIQLVKALAVISGPHIRVNSVSPGLLLTDWGMKFSQEKRDAAQARTKLKRFATVEDCAEQVLCFAKSKSVTGTNAVIDAGSSL